MVVVFFGGNIAKDMWNCLPTAFVTNLLTNLVSDEWWSLTCHQQQQQQQQQQQDAVDDCDEIT